MTTTSSAPIEGAYDPIKKRFRGLGTGVLAILAAGALLVGGVGATLNKETAQEGNRLNGEPTFGMEFGQYDPEGNFDVTAAGLIDADITPGKPKTVATIHLANTGSAAGQFVYYVKDGASLIGNYSQAALDTTKVAVVISIANNPSYGLAQDVTLREFLTSGFLAADQGNNSVVGSGSPANVEVTVTPAQDMTEWSNEDVRDLSANFTSAVRLAASKVVANHDNQSGLTNWAAKNATTNGGLWIVPADSIQTAADSDLSTETVG